MSDARIRTLIVDDEPLALRRLRALLADEPDIEIVAEAVMGRGVRASPRSDPISSSSTSKCRVSMDSSIARDGGIHQPFVVFVTAHDEHAIRVRGSSGRLPAQARHRRRFREAVRRVVARLSR